MVHDEPSGGYPLASASSPVVGLSLHACGAMNGMWPGAISTHPGDTRGLGEVNKKYDGDDVVILAAFTTESCSKEG